MAITTKTIKTYKCDYCGKDDCVPWLGNSILMGYCDVMQEERRVVGFRPQLRVPYVKQPCICKDCAKKAVEQLLKDM